MANFFSTLSASGNTLDVLQQALDITQNNVSNASTPGYARQRLSLEAMSFQPADGLPGGVAAGQIQSARDDFADQEVRSNLQSLSYFDQESNSLEAIQNVLSPSGSGGLDGALNTLFQSFSAWSVTPNSPAARQAVLDAAGTVAQTFQRTASGIGQVATGLERQIQGTVDQINNLGAKLQSLNAQRQRGGSTDGGLDARIEATLEQLSQLADISTLRESDGTVTVLLGGQTPLVIGNTAYKIHAETDSSSSPPVRILDSLGHDATDSISGGQLGGLLEVRNAVIPSLVGDATQPGNLNRLAQSVAGRVNELLQSGNITDGPPPQSGVPLFTYDTANPTGAAASLKVTSTITAGQLAAIDPGPPASANGIALKLAGLSASSSAADQIDGSSYVDFFGTMAARLGTQVSNARDSRDAQKQAVAQAQSLRSQISGVSLNEEALHLIEFQRAYEATAKVVTVLSSLTQTLVNLIP